jgi:hypothetical protein
MKRVCAGLLALIACLAHAEQDTRWLFQTSLYTTHFSPKPHHNNHQALLGLEYYPEEDTERLRQTLYGGATFRNSFGQRSVFIYTGWRFDHPRWPVYGKVAAGLLHGYRGEHRDNIPFNNLGIAPAILPAAGIQVGQYSSEIVLFGLAGLMVNVGFSF